MDPLSITSGALGCITAIAQTSKAITNFIRGCREARSDLVVTSRELSELGIVLELLKDDSDVADDHVIPEVVQRQIPSVLANWKDVIGKIDDLLAQHDGKTGAARWVLSGKRDAANLRQSLEAHRGALGLALETVTLWVHDTCPFRQDTTALHNATTDIKVLKHPKVRHDNVLYGIREGADSKLFLVRQVLFTLGSLFHNRPIDVQLLPIVASPVPNFEVSPDAKMLAIHLPPLRNAVLIYDLPPIPGVSEADMMPLEAVEPYTIKQGGP